VTMKASALSAAIPILGSSAEDPKQMKRGDPFGLVLRVGSVQRLDLPEPAQAEKHVAPSHRPGPAPSRSPPGEDAAKTAKFKET
jgi:hypothetical protein